MKATRRFIRKEHADGIHMFYIYAILEIGTKPSKNFIYIFI